METIKLGQWARYFPDGISLSAYNRIGRLIKSRGPLVKIKIIKGDHVSLQAALDKLEKE